jgi:4a-hydroxytetrahydrobiopterin dehydratase
VSQLLPDLDIQRSLGKLPGWARRGTVLTKSYKFGTFRAGIDFVNRAAAVADRMDHHPDIDIRFTKITCTLSTHDAGGITQKDLTLAAELDQVAGDALA